MRARGAPPRRRSSFWPRGATVMTKRINRPRKKTGRPRKAAPPYISTSAHIEALASTGLKVIGVARALGTSKDRLSRWLDEDPELAEAFERGRATLELEAFNVLYRTMKGRRVAARDRIIAAM